MADLQAAVTGTLAIKPAPQSPPQHASTGCHFGFRLRSDSEAPAGEISQACHTVSGAGFQDLPFPSNLRARVLYLRVLNNTAADIRLTRVTAAQHTIPQIRGAVLLEFMSDDEVTAVEVQGDGVQIEWAAFGPNA